jgi:hypothetical protein
MSRVIIKLVVLASQIRTVLSLLPEMMRSRPPACPNATADTRLVWPVSGSPTGCPLAASQIRTVSSLLPKMMRSRPPARAEAAIQMAVAVRGGRLAVAGGVLDTDQGSFYTSHDHSVTANGLIRDALSPYPDDLVIATKVGLWSTADGKLSRPTIQLPSGQWSRRT